MPFLTIHSNNKPKNTEMFLQDAAQFVASELHKPISYVIVTLDYQPQMIFGGDKDITSALVEMKSNLLPKKILSIFILLICRQKICPLAVIYSVKFILKLKIFKRPIHIWGAFLY